MILNTADVPNIYESDEKAEITEHVIIVFLLWTNFIRLLFTAIHHDRLIVFHLRISQVETAQIPLFDPCNRVLSICQIWLTRSPSPQKQCVSSAGLRELRMTILFIPPGWGQFGQKQLSVGQH